MNPINYKPSKKSTKLIHDVLDKQKQHQNSNREMSFIKGNMIILKNIIKRLIFFK